MTITKKPSKETVSEKQVSSLINKGGSTANTQARKVKQLQLRLYDDVVSEIDDILSKLPGKVSRHSWIVDAIQEKLEKERGK